MTRSGFGKRKKGPPPAAVAAGCRWGATESGGQTWRLHGLYVRQGDKSMIFMPDVYEVGTVCPLTFPPE